MSNNGGITQVGEYDVLVGRGQSKFTHRGNVILRYKIAAILPYYKNTNSRRCKSVVANHVTRSVLLHGGRFLQQVPKNQQRGKEKEWIDIGFEGGIIKVCFSFRDAVRNRVKLVKDLLFQHHRQDEDNNESLKKNGNQDESGCRRWRSHYQVQEMMSSFDAQHKKSGMFSFIDDDDAEEVTSPFAPVSPSSCKKQKKRGKSKNSKRRTKRSTSKSLSSSSKPVFFNVENEEQNSLEPLMWNPKENNHLISEMKFLSSIFGNGSSKEDDELSTFLQCWTMTDDDEDSFCSTEQHIQSNNKVNSKKQQQQFHSNKGMDDESWTMLSDECSDVSSDGYSVDLIDAADDVLALL